MSRTMTALFPYLLCCKRTKTPSSCLELEIDCRDNVSWFCLSTNSILKITLNDKHYYFRVCAPICDTFSYVSQAIDEFLFLAKNTELSSFGIKDIPSVNLNLPQDTVKNLGAYLNNKRRDRTFMNLLSEIDTIYKANNYSIWNGTTFNAEIFETIGFRDVQPSLENAMSLFLWFMKGKMQARQFNFISNDGYHSYFYSVKSMASRIIAEELQQASLIVPSTYCRIKLNDRIFFGILSEEAPGERMKDASPDNYKYIQRHLLNMNILDYICMQKDHGANNYCIWQNNQDSSICAFDNDNAFTFFPVTSTAISLSGASILIDKNGCYNRPYVDESMLFSLDNIDFKRITSRLKPHLNTIQIIALKQRMIKIRNAIKRSLHEGCTSCLAANEWSDSTVTEEIFFSRNNETYLSLAKKQATLSSNLE